MGQWKRRNEYIEGGNKIEKIFTQDFYDPVTF